MPARSAASRGQRGDRSSLRGRLAGVRLIAWRRRRRQAKKRWLAAMSRRRRVLRRVGVTGTWLLSMVAAVLIAAIVGFYALSNVPRPDSVPLAQVATITYADGSALARIGTVDRTIVALSQVPVQVRWDVLAAEDRGFYSEPGVSIKGTLRAALSDLSGGDVQGGSTITQQYAKNVYLSDARTLSRKLRELAIAVKLDREYSKDQILEFYLNTVYFGRGTYGIEAAAQTYFGVGVDRLDVSQGAVLAALLRAPSYYDPAVNPTAAKDRWRYVLDGMVTVKQLTAAQAAAITYPKVLPVRDNGLGAVGPTALIVQRVLAELQANGISESEVYARGMHIQTTIDRSAQSAALSAIKVTFATLTPQQRTLKNALVAVNPATGGVLAYYGGPNGTNYAGLQDEFDYAGIGSRPAGSSFKPYTLATVLTQTLQKTPGKPPLTLSSHVDGSYRVTIQGTKIQNDPGDLSVSGPSVTIANAIKYSLNTTFDLLAAEAGPGNVAKTAHAAGISPADASGRPTLVEANGHTAFGIGIGDYAVRPIDQAVGFATFADNGIAHDPYFVQKVTDANGAVVYQHKNAGTQVLDPKVANDVTLALEPIAAFSGDPLANARVSAAKTGTVGIQNDPNGNNSDAWMVGYTPQVSAAVWVGSGNSTKPIFNAYGGSEYGSDLPGRTWALFLDTYLANKPLLPMATTQLITGGVRPTASPTPSPTKSRSTSPDPSSSRPTTIAPVSSRAPTPTPTTSTGSTSSAPQPSSCTPPVLTVSPCPIASG